MGNLHYPADEIFPCNGAEHPSLLRDKTNEINLKQGLGWRIGVFADGNGHVPDEVIYDPSGEPVTHHYLDQFLAVLAHELRNPLGPIHNAVEVLRLTGPKEPATERLESIIERQLARLTRLVDDLLEVSRAGRGKLDLKTGPVLLSEVLARAMELAGPLVQSRRQQFEFRPPEEGLSVQADLDRLVQACVNLLLNAAKFTPEGGWIRLEAWAHGHEAVIQVSDGGVGIAPEDLPRIFDMFTRAGVRAPGGQRGLGLGLNLTRTLIQLHGGTLEAASDGPGQGSRFTVRLPQLAARPVASPPLPGRERNGSARHNGNGHTPRRVLVVDDMIDSASTLADLIALWGCEVRVANSGNSALKIAGEFLPEVVLLDIGMPGMDGYEVARRLRQEYGKAMTIVAQTGYSQPQDRDRAVQAGFDRHLVKPVDIQALRLLLGIKGN